MLQELGNIAIVLKNLAGGLGPEKVLPAEIPALPSLGDWLRSKDLGGHAQALEDATLRWRRHPRNESHRSRSLVS